MALSSHRKQISVSFVFLLTLVVLAACGRTTPFHDIVVYPGATSVSEAWFDTDRVRVSVYASPDEPQAILAFYQEQVSQTGWMFIERRSDYVSFRRLNDQDPTTELGLQIKVALARDGTTTIELTQFRSPLLYFAPKS